MPCLTSLGHFFPIGYLLPKLMVPKVRTCHPRFSHPDSEPNKDQPLDSCRRMGYHVTWVELLPGHLWCPPPYSFLLFFMFSLFLSVTIEYICPMECPTIVHPIVCLVTPGDSTFLQLLAGGPLSQWSWSTGSSPCQVLSPLFASLHPQELQFFALNWGKFGLVSIYTLKNTSFWQSGKVWDCFCSQKLPVSSSQSTLQDGLNREWNSGYSLDLTPCPKYFKILSWASFSHTSYFPVHKLRWLRCSYKVLSGPSRSHTQDQEIKQPSLNCLFIYSLTVRVHTFYQREKLRHAVQTKIALPVIGKCQSCSQKIGSGPFCCGSEHECLPPLMRNLALNTFGMSWNTPSLFSRLGFSGPTGE